MANKGWQTVEIDQTTSGAIPVNVVGTVSLAATPTIDLGDVTLLAGTALIGKVGIDQTTPGTTDSVTVATAQGAGAAIGATTGAAVITDADGTIQRYLRGLVKRWADALGAGTGAASLRVNLATDVALPAGTNLLGKAGIDQTTPGTTNAVQANVVSGGIAAGAVATGALVDGADLTQGVTTGAAVITDANGTVQQYLRGLVKLWIAGLAAGSAIIGKVGIDQTTPGTTNGIEPSNGSAVASVAYAASQVVKAAAGSLYGISGYNSGPAQWIQVHNTTTLPANTAVPIITFKVPATDNFSWDSGGVAYPFATGITLGNSTTGPTLTTGAADCWFNALYR